jgi:hypothetical protein
MLMLPANIFLAVLAVFNIGECRAYFVNAFQIQDKSMHFKDERVSRRCDRDSRRSYAGDEPGNSASGALILSLVIMAVGMFAIGSNPVVTAKMKTNRKLTAIATKDIIQRWRWIHMTVLFQKMLHVTNLGNMTLAERINRPLYPSKLIDREGDGAIKVTTGLRRCGKSYLLFKIFVEHLRKVGVPDGHIIQAALDDDRFENLLDRHALGKCILERIVDDAPYFVMLDEIQEVKGFERTLNGLARIPNADIYVTGSNSKILSSDVITEFRGRGDEVRVRPLSFSEFCPAHKGSLRHGLGATMTGSCTWGFGTFFSMLTVWTGRVVL